MPRERSSTTRACFVSFAYADLTIPREFEVVFDLESPEQSQDMRSRVVAVTQQWGKVFDEIPDGWETVCAIEFPEGIPALVDALPTVDSWRIASRRVGLCSKIAYPEIVEARRRRTTTGCS